MIYDLNEKEKEICAFLSVIELLKMERPWGQTCTAKDKKHVVKRIKEVLKLIKQRMI